MTSAEPKRVTAFDLVRRKAHGPKIVGLTAYETVFASLVDQSGADFILVGDSLAQVFAGYEHTVSATMDQMVYHTEVVARAVGRALVIGDMPFLSYRLSSEETLRNAGRLVQEGRAQAVKLEGTGEVVAVTKKVTESGIPAMGHLGLTPQAVHQTGYHLQAKTEVGQRQLLDDARRLQDAGAFSLVLEMIPTEVAAAVTESLEIPTVGIGAGPHTDGQILVTQDLLGLFEHFAPSFVRRYANVAEEVRRACRAYANDVREGRFPGAAESFKGEAAHSTKAT